MSQYQEKPAHFLNPSLSRPREVRPQPTSYQSASPSHNQNLPRADARASSLSFPQRLAKGLEIKLQMTRESSACPTLSRSLRDPRPARPQSRRLKEAVPWTRAGGGGRPNDKRPGLAQGPGLLGAPSVYLTLNPQSQVYPPPPPHRCGN